MYASVGTVPPMPGVSPLLCCTTVLPPPPPSEVVGTWMWLACREALAGSLAHLHSHCPRLSSPLSLERVCEEGQREASACGALGTVARLHWYRAVHCLARKKADVDCAVSNLEVSYGLNSVQSTSS